MTRQKKITIGIFACIFLLFLIYALGIIFYSERCFPNTYINNINCSSDTLKKVESKIHSKSNDYVLTVIRNDGSTEQILGRDFDYRSSSREELGKIIEDQNILIWPASLWSNKNYTVKIKVEFDENKLRESIERLNCLTSLAIREPVDAHVEITEKGYEVIEEDNGNKLNKELTIKSIINTVKQGLDTIDLDKSACYLKAKIKKDDPSIQKTVNKVKRATDMKIVYIFGKESETINSSVISSWISFTKKGNIKFDSDKIKQYVKNLAVKYDTYGKKRTFKTHDGKKIVIKNGILGWQIDVDSTVKHLEGLIKEGKNIKTQPKYSLYCLTRKNNDIGDTYIEISISKQHLWLYKNGKVDYEFDVVTGLSNGERDTPKGAFVVWSREKGATLGTYAVQGYATHVDYWMPFSWVGCGLHDATWRSNFGGSIYKTNGSHGCVNCPPSSAKYLYENIKTGTPVIIY